MCHADNEKKNRGITDRIELSDQESMRTLGENENYKYLKKLEVDFIKQAKMKGNIKKAYLRWTR